MADTKVTDGAPEVKDNVAPGGSGKTSLLRLCAGLLPVERGTATVLGCDLVADRTAVRNRVGLLGHANNYVEHPELIAEYLVRYANLVGRENVIASANCGFSSRASYAPEVHPSVVWPKFKALREGADIASAQLWASGR